MSFATAVVPNKDHEKLEADILQFLIGEGYEADKTGYHETLKTKTIEEDGVEKPVFSEAGLKMIARLQKMCTPTASYIRAGADITAVAAHDCLFVEAKTNDNGKYRNYTVEALPLVHHIREARECGVKCLYVCRDVVDGHEGAFWAESPPRLSRIIVPQGWKPKRLEYLLEQFKAVLGTDMRIDVRGPKDNPVETVSGDPFAIILKEDRGEMIDNWQEEIQRLSGKACWGTPLETVTPERLN